MKFLILSLSFLFSLPLLSQSEIDSLTQKKYTELSSRVRENIDNQKEALIYAKAYLNKAKKENNQLGLGTGYRLHANIFRDKNLKISYLDSAINATLNMDHQYYPALLLLYRGGIYYDQKRFKASLQDYLMANTYAKNNNEELYYTIKFNVGIIKRQIGNFEEAENIFDQCLEYESEYKDFDDGDMYFSTLFQLSNVYYETKQFSKATEINSRGILETLARKDSTRYYHFVVNEGINLTLQKKYTAAIDSIYKAIDHIETKDDLAVVYHYLGLALYENDQKKQSIPYFQKVDSIFLETYDLLPSCRSTYEKLINYFKETKDLKNQLLYTTRLLKLDSILSDDYKYLVKNVYKEYDFPELMSYQKELIAELENNSKTTTYWNIFLMITVIVSTIFLIYYYKQKKKYKQRFDTLIGKEKLQTSESNTIKNTSKVLEDVDEETVNKVLLELDNFIKNKSYLKNQITLNDVAKLINTNTKYLSKIINHYQQKNFNTYINDLRIEYLIDRLNTDKNFRKYTISAIAEEGGFSNALSFSRAFTKKTSLKPSYFLKELNKR
ncbi:AraC family transcriptional regulator [Kordia jejudonensis]|uniref:AraC family transcriptional regulator n=1 Tax=Kordia jejudonensis TaxID=1348245 RepID=UPI0006290200|nr:AraC family transcriptional regulator [Kordia jejudonensis]